MGNALNNPIIRNALEHHHLLTHFSHFTVTHHYPWMATSMCDQNFEATKTMLMSLKNVMEHTARHLTFHIHPSHPFNRTYTLDRFRNCLGGEHHHPHQEPFPFNLTTSRLTHGPTLIQINHLDLAQWHQVCDKTWRHDRMIKQN